MYEQFFGLSENPFSLTPDPRFIFASRSHDEAVAHLRYWVEHHEGFATITGEVGTGKTTALFRLIEGMDRHVEVAFVTNSMLSPVELLEEICRKFRIDIERDLSKPGLLSKLEAYLLRLNQLGHGAVLIIDEAQNFDHSLLEEVRLLSNVAQPGGRPLLQIALVGQPELERRLNLPELRQLKQRIGVHYRIQPLSQDETARYIHHRVSVAGGAANAIFPPETSAAIYARTFGLPREINQVASQALLHAYVEESPAVRPDHIESAVEEMGFKSVLDRPGVTLTMAPPMGAGTTARPAENPAHPAPFVPSRPASVPARAAAGRETTVRRMETTPEPQDIPAPSTVTSPGATQHGSARERGGRVPAPAFQAIPPIQAPASGSLKPASPVVRRLALTGVIVVIIGAAALLLFAPPRHKSDEVAEIESEATIPQSTRPQVLTEPTVTSIIPGIDPAKTKPPAASQATGPLQSTANDSIEPRASAAPAAAPPEQTSIRDSIEHKPVTPSVPRTSRDAMAGYHLQVASLRDSAVAESMGRRLARLSESAFHVDRFSAGTFPWYAVYVGPYETRAEAESVRVQLVRADRTLEGSLIRPPSTH